MRRCVLGGIVLMAMVGCARPRNGLLVPATEQWVWPPPPAAPRVRFVGQIAGELQSKAEGGRVLREFFFGPEGHPHLVTPYALAVHSDGNRVAIADPNAGCVHLLDLQRDQYSQIAAVAKNGSALESPVGVAWAGDVLCVADAELRKVVLVNGERQDDSIGEGELIRPSGVAFNPINGLLYVCDAAAHGIFVFDLDGRLVRRIGSRGGGPGQFNYPCHIACEPEGTLVVADALNFRVQRFAPDGEFLGHFGQKGDAGGDFALPKGVAVDSRGAIWVVDAQFENVQAFDRDGRLLLVFGREGREPGEFWLPAGMAIDGQDRMWIADSYNRRVQVFELLP